MPNTNKQKWKITTNAIVLNDLHWLLTTQFPPSLISNVGSRIIVVYLCICTCFIATNQYTILVSFVYFYYKLKYCNNYINVEIKIVDSFTKIFAFEHCLIFFFFISTIGTNANKVIQNPTDANEITHAFIHECSKMRRRAHTIASSNNQTTWLFSPAIL